MCPPANTKSDPNNHPVSDTPENGSSGEEQTPFPWNIPIYDAHCHPTDTPSSLPTIPSMRTRVLTIMSTRSQDQSLVDATAQTQGVTSADPSTWTREQCVVPCFGWHPWFAHLMWIPENEEQAEELGDLTSDAKLNHYLAVLQPPPKHQHEPLPSIRANPTHPFHSLPNPTSFAAFLTRTKAYLQSHPLALIGEIGLDRSFRIPDPSAPARQTSNDEDVTPGTRQGRPLTAYRVAPAHQKALFQAQLRLAGEMGRAVSVHGVQAHGMVYEAVRELWSGHERKVPSKKEKKKRGPNTGGKEASINTPDATAHLEEPKPFPPRLCLHSYSGNASNFRQYVQPAVPVEVFASFSTAINLGDELDGETPQSFVDTVRAVPDDRVLVESDLHTAGPEMDRRMEDIVRRICAVKGWGLEDGCKRLERNWRRFVFGKEGEKEG